MEIEDIFYYPANHMYPGGGGKFKEEYPKLGRMNMYSLTHDIRVMNEIEYEPIPSDFIQVPTPPKAYYVISTKFSKRIERYGLANRLTNRTGHIVLFLDNPKLDDILIDSMILEVELDRVNDIKVYWQRGTTNQTISVFQNIPPIYIKVVGEVEVNPHIQ